MVRFFMFFGVNSLTSFESNSLEDMGYIYLDIAHSLHTVSLDHGCWLKKND